MPLLEGIHTTERAAGRAGNLDSPASEAMAVPSSAFSGLAQGAGMATGQPQGEGTTNPALSSGPRAIYVTLSGPSAQLCQSGPLGPRTICVPLGDLTPAKLTARSIPLGPGTVSVPLGHITLPELTARSVPMGPGTISVPTEWPHRRALAIAPRHGSDQNSRPGAGPITKRGSSACPCHPVHRLGSAASSAFNSNSSLPEHS